MFVLQRQASSYCSFERPLLRYMKVCMLDDFYTLRVGKRCLFQTIGLYDMAKPPISTDAMLLLVSNCARKELMHECLVQSL